MNSSILSPIHCLQFLLFSICVNFFTFITYLVLYSDRLYFIDNIEKEYDYIVVGSGTAGSVVAHRLATETNHSFIVLEAGTHGHFLLEMPVLGPFMHRSVFDWQFESEPQDGACLAIEYRKCRLPQGKIVGGSSKLNNMVHVRGNIDHYVRWFHRQHSKNYIKQQFEYIEDEIIHLNSLQYNSELADALMEAAKELGYKTNDPNFLEGFSKSKVSQKDGKRWSTSDNLLTKHVVTNALVDSIIFDGNTASGVNVEIYGRKTTIHAKNMVILSAGAINSPKILQLSGIGPKNVLEPLNISLVKELPVGKNLQDHVGTGLDLILFNSSVSVDAMDMYNPINIAQYFLNGKGPITTPGCEVVGFISTENQKDSNLQFMVLPVGLTSDKGSHFRTALGVKDDIWYNYFVKTFDKYTSSILPIVLHPQSKGEVYIKSKDVAIPPVYNPNYLSNQRDVETLMLGLKVIKKLLESDAMKNLGGYLNPNHFPGCESHQFFSDSYLECYVRHLTLTSYHPVGTCSMGLPDSNETVVDLNFKVLGLNNLYVVDASVLPSLPGGNINAAVAMMASVFFDTNIGAKMVYEADSLYCKNRHVLYETLWNVCLIS